MSEKNYRRGGFSQTFDTWVMSRFNANRFVFSALRILLSFANHNCLSIKIVK